MSRGKFMNKYLGMLILGIGMLILGGMLSLHTVNAASKTAAKVAKVPIASVENRNSTTQRITWEPTSGVTGYEVYSSTSKTGKYTLASQVKGASKKSVDVKSLTLGKTYYYKVRAYLTANGKTTYGAYSSVKSLVAAPANPVLVDAKLTADDAITISWNKVTEANGYVVYRKVSDATKWTKIATINNKNTTSFAQERLKLATEYRYTVAAYKLDGKKQVIGGYDAEGKVMSTAFTVDRNSAPYLNRFVKNANYNTQTKHYFLIRSYLEYFNEIGGGKLILKKGTYNIPCMLYIPSNVEIELQNGVVINKTDTVGKKCTLSPSARLFMFIDNNGKDVKNGTTAYKGVHDVRFYSSGKATINMPTEGGYIFTMAHNSDIQISNIKMCLTGKSTKAVYVGGSQNITISGCSVDGRKEDSYGVWIDPMISGTTQYFTWAKMDNTMCKNIYISDGSFNNLRNAIYTNRFMSKKYQTNVRITNNTFSNTSDDSIRVMNWKKPIIKDNQFSHIGKGAVVSKDLAAAILMFGADTPTITGNSFDQVERAVHFGFNKNSDSKLSKQGTTSNNVTKSTLNTIASKNNYGKMGDYFVSIIGPKDVELTRVWIPDSTNELVMRETDTPYRNQYMWSSDYNEKSRQYYTFRSYLNQLERVGGGTLTLKAGTYNMSFRLVVPSNVTLKFEDGVVINCAYKETENGVATGALFNLVSETDLDKGVKYTEFNGAHDITFEGPSEGTAIINMNYMSAIGIKYAHTKNVTIRNITFNGLDASGSHYIECDASKNVLIENNIFSGHKYMSVVSNREAINLDIPDENTNGFTASYTSYDCTANDGVVIRNNVFENLPSGVGTHIYTENHPHKNIEIYGNSFTNMSHYAIRCENWDGFEIYDNTINKVGDKDEGEAIFFMGVMNAKVYQNTIANTSYFMKVRPAYYEEDFFSDKKSYFTETEKRNLMNYAMVQNDFDESDCERMGLYDNELLDSVEHHSIMYRNNRGDSYVYWDMKQNTDFTINPSSTSYMGSNEVPKSDETHDYRVFLSYLKRIELMGGGTLTVQAGTYNICSTLYIPSNTTIILESGVNLIKGTSSKYLFTTMSYDNRDLEGTYGAYQASENVTIKGEFSRNANGTIEDSSLPVISVAADNTRQAIKVPQSRNVTISGISFKGSSSLAYIDIYSSKDVTISDCRFTGATGSTDAKGVNLVAYYNNVVCKNITVENCNFKNLYYGIYTKTGSAMSVDAGLYHTGIKITGCKFSAMNAHNINGECWKAAEITHNTFNGPGSDASNSIYAIRLYYYNGTSLVIENNTIKNYYNGLRVPEIFGDDCEAGNEFSNCFVNVRRITGE